MENGGGPTRYEIVVRGRLSERSGAAFEAMTIRSGGGLTTLSGDILDQSHLYGVINGLRDLGIELVSVTAQPDEHSQEPRRMGAR
jgi:hypothetical protein